MKRFNVGDEVIFKNYRLELNGMVTYTDKFMISSGRISHCIPDEFGDIRVYFIKAVDSSLSFIDVHLVPHIDVIRTVSSLDELELSK